MSEQGIRPGWATTIRNEKNYTEASPELWKRLYKELRQEGADTFQESYNAPFKYHELLVKENKYVVIYSHAHSADSFFMVRFEGDPMKEFSAFYKAIVAELLSEIAELENEGGG